MNYPNSPSAKPVRVLYSFPHKLGADRICHTAWQQVNGIAAAGADVLTYSGVLHKAVLPNVRVRTTLALGRLRIPYSLLGKMRAFALHDYIVSRQLEKLAGKIDIVHAWPVAAIRTLKAAARLGIPTVLERPNAHTRFAYEVVRRECERLGLELPPGHEHAYHADVLKIEEQEYRLADRLLCPSDFVRNTFLQEGYPGDKLLRHQYGFDESVYFPRRDQAGDRSNLTVLFVGGCAPRKGLHYALEAWCQSAASQHGTFLIAGAFVPGYAELLAGPLSHPRVKILGHRSDVAELMRSSDVLILPTIEEGSALVTYEARACGCVLLVSEAAGAICTDQQNALVHTPGDVSALSRHLTLLSERPDVLAQMRKASLETAPQITWSVAGERLLRVYQEVISQARPAPALA